MTSKSDPRVRFLIRMGRVLHSYGIPSHRLEAALGNASRRLGVRAEFLSTPTSLISSFGEPGDQYLNLARVHPGSLQLARLVELDDVVEALYRGDLSVEDAERRFDAVVERPAPYGEAAQVAAFAVASSAAAAFFGGGWPDMVAACVLGLAGGLLGLAAGRSETMGRLLEFLVAVVAAFGAAGMSRLYGELNVATVIIGSVVVLLPGLSLTVALNELGTGHLVAGTARLTGSMMTFLQLGLGVAVGTQLALALPGAMGPGGAPALPPAVVTALLVVTAVALLILFQGRVRELPWLVGGALLAFWGSRAGVGLLGAGLGAGVGAFLVGLAGNLYARWRRRPAVVVIVPSIIVLVPGSIGYRSFGFMLEKDVLSGIDSLFTALLVAVSLVAGLLLANVFVPPRNAL